MPLGKEARVRRRDEVALFARCAGNDPDAWERFLALYRPALLRLVAWMHARAGDGRRADPEEGVSEILARLLQDGGAKLRAYDGRASPETWLGMIALTVVYGGARRRRTETDRRAEAAAVRRMVEEEDPAGSAVRTEEIERLREEVRSLPPRQRLAIRLVYEKGLDRASAARLLGASGQALADLLYRSRVQLRERLE